MNTNTGEIKFFDEHKEVPEGYTPIDFARATPAQKRDMRVHLEDEVSPLGQQLQKARAKLDAHHPHVGAKQLAKIAKREAEKLAKAA